MRYSLVAERMDMNASRVELEEKSEGNMTETQSTGGNQGNYREMYQDLIQ